MKTVIAFVALAVAAVIAAPALEIEQPTVTRELQHNNIGTEDGYQYAFEQSDGHKRQERADWVQPRSADQSAFLRVTGSYSYYNPHDGQTYLVEYTADENGFHPKGAHILVPEQ